MEWLPNAMQTIEFAYFSHAWWKTHVCTTAHVFPMFLTGRVQSASVPRIGLGKPANCNSGPAVMKAWLIAKMVNALKTIWA